MPFGFGVDTRMTQGQAFTNNFSASSFVTVFFALLVRFRLFEKQFRRSLDFTKSLLLAS